MAVNPRCRLRRAVAASTAVLVLSGASCGGDGVSAPTIDTVVPPVADGDDGPSPTSPSSMVPSTAAVPGTTPVWSGPETCGAEIDEALAVVDETSAAARLEPGGSWNFEVDSSRFAERTHSADEFRHRMALDCGLRAVQVTELGEERFVVAAWTGDRRAFVIQATDAPAIPFAQSITFQLFIDQVDGEWIVDGEVWAGTRDNGETIVVAALDTSTALAAKSWWNEVPRFDDIEVTLETQRAGIELLESAGARNVSVAEPADVGSEIAALQFATPDGLHLIATVAPVGSFDPAAQLFDGERTVEVIDGVEVHVTAGAPDAYAVASVGWVCDGLVWFVDSVWGSVAELTEWAADMIAAGDC